MPVSRRKVATILGSGLLGSAGCLDDVPTQTERNDSDGSDSDGNDTDGNDSETTREFPVEDLSVLNERDEPVEVTVTVTEGSNSVLEETFTLEPDETRTYEDVMANEREYEVTVSADGMTKTETFDEHRDNTGLEFSIRPEKIESVEIVH